jgi:hypothetical protein
LAWLKDWTYRNPFALYRASGAVVDYQLKINIGESSGVTGVDVNCGGLVSSNFNDLRFTNSSGHECLSYWVDGITGTTPNQKAVVWVKFDSIGVSDTTFYMYYGNKNAPAYSSGQNTFIFFEDFNSYTAGVLNGQGGWSGYTQFAVQETVKYEGSKALYLNNTIVNIDKTIGMLFPDYWTMPYIFVEWKGMSTAGAYYVASVEMFERSFKKMGGCFYGSFGPAVYVNISTWYCDLSLTTTYNVWHDFRISVESSTHYYFYYDGVWTYSGSSMLFNLGAYTPFFDTLRLNQGQTGASSYWDRIFIGHYRVPNPVFSSWGAQETQIQGSLPFLIRPTGSW